MLGVTLARMGGVPVSGREATISVTSYQWYGALSHLELNSSQSVEPRLSGFRPL